MKKKVLAFIVCSCLIFGCTGTVFADEAISADEAVETEAEETGSGSGFEEENTETEAEGLIVEEEAEEAEETEAEEDLLKTEETFKLLFDANGGQGSRSYEEWTTEDAIPNNGSGFIRYGYAFDGWYTEKECINKINEFTYIDRDTTLYAGWTSDYYTLYFDGNGGTVKSIVDLVAFNTVNIKKNSRIQMTTGVNIPYAVRTGYYFDGFTYTKDGNDYVDLDDIITGDTVVYAKWIKDGESSDKPDGLVFGVSYRTHVQSYGWQNYVHDGEMSGTQGESKRLEGISIHLTGNYEMLTEPDTYGIIYRTHVQTYGWQDWAADGAMAGTSGESKRLEAIQIMLNHKMAQYYDVYYQTHIQHFGWSAWAKNGEQCGSAGYSYRLEGIRIQILKKGSAPPVNENSSAEVFYSKNEEPVINPGNFGVAYNTHVQTYGWQDYVYNGDMAGTSGQSKRLEGIHIALVNSEYTGDIVYRTHVQTYGWQDWKINGEMSGTSGESKRLEGIQIYLTGDLAKYYDVYYCVHAQTYGWLDWAKNGEMAGTSGLSRRLEGIKIVFREKGEPAPGSTAKPNVVGEGGTLPDNPYSET